jgi:RNA polymerase subunit RPABC4/transcription elongation factor Spt4
MKHKECPSCAMNIDVKSKECPICGYAFIEATPWIKYMAIFLIIVLLLSYFIF